MSLEALIFDVDGTLADTEEAHRQAFNAAFLEFELGWDWDPALYARLLLVSGGKERIAAYIEESRVPEAERRRLQNLVPMIHTTKTRIYAELLENFRLPLRPGVARLIAEAREAGLRLGIATTTTPANVEALLFAALGAGSSRWFDVVAAGDLVARKKPAPDVYLAALAGLRLSPEACVAFEDSVNGVHAARAAGLVTIATPTRWTADEDFSAAQLVVEGLGDAEHPLKGASAARVGAPMLGIAQVRRVHGAAQAAA